MFQATLEKCAVMVRKQFKLTFTRNMALAFLLCLLTPMIFGTSYLDDYGSAFVLERYISLIGIILCTPLFLPEQDKIIAELIDAKQTAYMSVISLRLVIAAAAVFLYCAGMVGVLKIGHCQFETVPYLLGTYVTAMFLGILGFTFGAVAGNTIVGYLVALSFYILNIGLGPKLKDIYLFSLSLNSYDEKYVLLTLTLFMTIITFAFKLIQRKVR